MQDYQIQKSIGTGSYGYVYLATHKSENVKYVIKKIKMWDLSSQQRQKIDNEVKLLRQFKHINIVRYRDSFIDNEGFLNIVMANCEGGDIYQLIQKSQGKKIEQKQIIDWAIQIALAIYYMHQKRVLHRDLKTSNIFLNHGKVRLGDFGISKVLDQTKNFLTQTNVGTPLYMSPQQLRKNSYSYKSDIWAFGCVLYEMCNQKHVFYAQSLVALAAKVFKGTYAPITQYYSQPLRDIIYKMLSQNPKKRPTIIQVLQNQFFKKRLQNYIRQVIHQGGYDKQLLQSLIDQANSLHIPLQNPKINSQSTPTKGTGLVAKSESYQKLKKQNLKAKEKLQQQILKQLQEKKKMIERIEKLKQSEIKKIAIKKPRQKSKSKEKSTKSNTQKSLHQRSSNNSLLSKKQSSQNIGSYSSSTKISSRKQQNKKQQIFKKKVEKPYLIIKKDKSQIKSKPFKMEQDHDLDYEQQSQEENVINQQIEQQEIKMSQQQKVSINQIPKKLIDNLIKDQPNFKQLQKQIQLKTQKINILQTELQSLENIDFQFSSDSEKQIQPQKLQNQAYNRMEEKINDLKHKIISILGREKYGKFMKYILSLNGKQNREEIRRALEQIVGENRIGLWHIGSQIIILQKMLEKIPKYL